MSLVAASALMIDYVMTVAVSTSSAVEQITSAFPVLFDERVLIGVVAIALITVGNLRGLREAGNIFAIPTYLFIGSALLMIGVGTFRIVVLGEGSTYGPEFNEQVSGTAPAADRDPAPARVCGRGRRADRAQRRSPPVYRPSSHPSRRMPRRPLQ